MTGVAYISNCTPKLTRKRRSRYLVVSEEMMMPKPSPSPAIINTSTGESSDPQPVGLHGRTARDEVEHEDQEQRELDGEGDQVGDQDGDRHGQAREIDLAEQAGVAAQRCWRSCSGSRRSRPRSPCPDM